MVTRTFRNTFMFSLAAAVAAWSVAASAQQKAEDAKPAEQAAQQQNQEQADAAAEAEAQPKWELRTFELKHRKPQEIQRLAALRAMPPTGAGKGFGEPAAAGVQQRTSFFRGAPEQAAIAVDNETNLLFVRGPAEQIERIAKAIEVLDVPHDQLQAQSMDDMRLIPLSKEHAQRIPQILGQLQLPHQVVNLDDGSALVICKSASEDEQAEAGEVEQVISKWTEARQASDAAGAQQQADQAGAEQQPEEGSGN